METNPYGNNQNTEPASFNDFRLFLQAELLKRCRQNPSYSLRAFAKQLQVDGATLSQMLRGKRSISQKMLIKLGQALGLGPGEMERFQKAPAQITQPVLDAEKFKQVSLDAFMALSEWYHDAILELTRLENFQPESKWIARKLGITVSEANIAVERLMRLGFLEVISNGKWKDVYQYTDTFLDGDYTSVALRKYQRVILEKASRAVVDVPRKRRDNTTLVMAIDEKDLGEVKSLIKKFRLELNGFLQRPSVKANQVYQLAIAFFPLTNSENGETHENE